MAAGQSWPYGCPFPSVRQIPLERDVLAIFDQMVNDAALRLAEELAQGAFDWGVIPYWEVANPQPIP